MFRVLVLIGVFSQSLAMPTLGQNNSLTFKGPQNDRQKAVVEAFLHSWNGYKKFAWGHDTLKPISGSYSNWFNVGLSILESLDTMYIMNLQEEFALGREWVEKTLDFDNAHSGSLFEVTIRALGSLLSAYHLTGDELFLTKADELGQRLISAFNTGSGIPLKNVNIKKGVGFANGAVDTAEVTTLQLEFRDLALSTGNKEYDEKVSAVSKLVHGIQINGLVLEKINQYSVGFDQSKITIGAGGDSYYEYLLKQWLQTGKKENE
jgi:mannosyl-oligosaccharide alpha-1,2-mannosidase